MYQFVNDINTIHKTHEVSIMSIFEIYGLVIPDIKNKPI